LGYSTRKRLGSWLKVEASPDGPQIALDENGVAAYLTSLGENLGPERYLDGPSYAAALAQAIRSGQDYAVIISHHSTRYSVQAGDTLLKVGWKVGMPYWKLLDANPGINPDAIAAGTERPSRDEPCRRRVVTLSVCGIDRQHMWITRWKTDQ
jgi:hypothetical protein